MGKAYRESNDGVTDRSVQFLKDRIGLIGPIVQARGYKDGSLDYWTEFSDKEGNKIVVSGFAWGYGGTGPHGLLQALRMVDGDIELEDIMSWPSDHGWRVMAKMHVKCERDGHKWFAKPRAYPVQGCQTYDEVKEGDMEITCPRCGRGYFLQADGTWQSDRELTILTK